MEVNYNSKLLLSNFPDSFSETLKNIIKAPNIDEKISKNEFFNTIDTLVNVLHINHIPLADILPGALKDVLDLSNTGLFNKKIQFVIQLEIARADLNLIQIHALGSLARSLCMQMALEYDSTAFYKFYIEDILPRYSKYLPQGFLLDLSSELELFEETKEFLQEIHSSTMPIKRKLNTTIKIHSPVSKNAKLSNKNFIKNPKKIKITRNLSGNSIKKLINIKGTDTLASCNASSIQLSISKKVQELTQEGFFNKKST